MMKVTGNFYFGICIVKVERMRMNYLFIYVSFVASITNSEILLNFSTNKSDVDVRVNSLMNSSNSDALKFGRLWLVMGRVEFRMSS